MPYGKKIQTATLLLTGALIIAYWTRFLALPNFVFYIGLIILSIIIFKKFKPEKTNLTKKHFLIGLLFLIIFSAQVLFLGYAPATDALHSTLLRIISESQKIPAAYVPYSDHEFTYTAAFHALASFFVFFEPYIVNWALGLICLFLLAMMFFVLIENKTNTKIAVISTILLLGTKLIYLDFLNGLYPRIMADLFIIFAVFLIIKKNNAWILPAIGLFIVHPLYALCGFVWILFELIKTKQLQKLLTLILIPILGLPVILQSYYAYFLSSGYGTIQNKIFISPTSLVLFFGVPTILIFVGTITYALLTNKNKLKSPRNFFTEDHIYLGFFIFLFCATYLISGLFDGTYPGVISLATFIIIIVIALTLFKINMLLANKFKTIIKKITPLAIIILLIFVLSNILISGDIQKRLIDGKISKTSAEFAFEFKKFDNNNERTLFIADASGKIAEYSNKIPFDVTNSFFLPYGDMQVIHSEAFKLVVEKMKIQNEILLNCNQGITMQSIYTTKVKYIVVDGNKYNCKIDLPEIFTYKNFDVYLVTK